MRRIKSGVKLPLYCEFCGNTLLEEYFYKFNIETGKKQVYRIERACTCGVGRYNSYDNGKSWN